jgi:hypothetical protein
MKKLIYVSFGLTSVGLWSTEVSVITVVAEQVCSRVAAVGQLLQEAVAMVG